MADDTPFIPPLGDYDLPTVEVDAAKLVDLIVEAIVRNPQVDGVHVACGCGGPSDGSAWTPIVIVEVADLRWLMSPTSARELAERLVRSRLDFAEPEAVVASFRHYAEKAELLAAGDIPFAAEEVH